MSCIQISGKGRMKKRRKAQTKGVPIKAPKYLYVSIFSFFMGSAITAGLFLLSKNSSNTTLAQSSQSIPTLTNNTSVDLFTLQNPKNPKPTKSYPTLYELLEMSPDELEKVDIEVMNLVCAQGLEGSEDLNIDECMKILDEWTEFLKQDIQKRLPAFPQYASNYDNSINKFKVVNMVLALENIIGVDYNLELLKHDTFTDSKNDCIHGCLTGKKKGACISIPTVCVSLGRRLGYPLKLVLGKGHGFFRWDDGQEVFNLEACCPGCDSPPDDHYLSFPEKVTEKEIKYNRLLKSLTPSGELALFLETRGTCLYHTGRTAEAQVMYALAYEKMPTMGRLGGLNKAFYIEVEKIKNEK